MRILEEMASFYHGSYSEDWSRLVQLFGWKEVLRMCKVCGLDEKYPSEYMELENKIKGNEENES